jgi:hypothetical protein
MHCDLHWLVRFGDMLEEDERKRAEARLGRTYHEVIKSPDFPKLVEQCIEMATMAEHDRQP